MTAAELHRVVDVPVDRVWGVLTDFAGYGRWIPLTSMVVDPPPVRPGWGFGGFTGLGRVGFLDSMLVTVWQPPVTAGKPLAPSPGRFRVVKTGRVLRGWADVTVRALPQAEAGRPRAGTTEVIWREQIVPRPEPVGRLLAPVSDRVTARLFAMALDRMLAAAAEGAPPAPPPPA